MQKTILVAVLLAGAGAAYFLGWQLPSSQKAQSVFDRSRQCQIDGSQFAVDYRDGTSSRGQQHLEAQYFFNEELNTCLVAVGWFIYSDDVGVKEVYDAYSNRILIKMCESKDPFRCKIEQVGTLDKPMLLSSDEFATEKAKLFTRRP